MLNPNSGEEISFKLDDDKFAYRWLSTSKTSDWNFDTDISGFEDSDVDLDDYNGFIHARFSDEKFTLNEIDD